MIGQHVTRKIERELLIDFIRRKNEGALLICGKRGVGKTSVVFSAIQEAKRLEEEETSKQIGKLKQEYRSEEASVLQKKQ